MSKKVLVYRLGSLGDTVVALPALHVVRRAFPDAALTLLTNKPVASKAAAIEAVLGPDFFTEVIDYPVGTRNPAKLWHVARRIRSGHFHAVVNLSAARGRWKARRDGLFFRMCGFGNIYGTPEQRGDFEVAPGPYGKHYESESLRLLRRVRSLGRISLEDPAAWALRLTGAERDTASALLPSDPAPMLVACFGTKAQANDWGEANWTKLLAVLRPRMDGWRLVTIGSADESALASRCGAGWGEAFVNLCGRLSPRESAAVLERARLFLGHDSGPMHLASAVGTPCVAVFSARNRPGQWFPARPGHRILYHQTECFGCGLVTCVAEKKKCILSITVDEVLAGIEVVLRAAKQQNA